MANLFKKFINRYHYSLESIKNRYPCKMIFVKNIVDFDKKTEIQYIAASKVNIRTSSVQDILDDPLLIEKFHPTDGVKLGFLACGEIFFKNNITMDESKKLYLKILNHMFEGIS
ncbi:MAG: hypothetical protein H0U75_11125 [Legionella sp.]|nr:hypothetical protein [Legionella sp.]